MNSRFARSLLFISGSITGTLFFFLITCKVFYRVNASLGRQGPMSPQWKWLLEFAGRPRQIPLMLDWMRLRAGEHILELGAGTGLFTILAARRIGKRGRLYAFDIQPSMIAEVQQKVKAAQLTNVHPQVASAYSLPLPDSSIDKALLMAVLPEIPDPQRALLELARVLKPQGALYVSGEFSVPDYWLIGETIQRVERSGLFILSTQHGNWWRYTLGFRKIPPALN